MHLLELLGVLQNDSSQDVQAEAEVVILYGQVCVEQTQRNLHSELPQQEASHPFEVHMVEVYALRLEVY